MYKESRTPKRRQTGRKMKDGTVLLLLGPTLSFPAASVCVSERALRVWLMHTITKNSKGTPLTFKTSVTKIIIECSEHLDAR